MDRLAPNESRSFGGKTCHTMTYESQGQRYARMAFLVRAKSIFLAKDGYCGRFMFFYTYYKCITPPRGVRNTTAAAKLTTQSAVLAYWRSAWIQDPNRPLIRHVGPFIVLRVTTCVIPIQRMTTLDRVSPLSARRPSRYTSLPSKVSVERWDLCSLCV